MIDLSNKTILVTGASKGIGAAIVQNLSKSNANIIAQYCSDKTGMEQVISSCAETNIVTYQADFKKEKEVENLWKKSISWRNGVDVLINNAAIIRFEGGIDDSDHIWKKTWDDTLAVNLMGPGSPSTIAYSASKSAVMNATKTIARHYAEENILTYTVSPGVVRTRMSEEYAISTNGEDAITQSLAMKEWVPPSDLANLVSYLSSGSCRHLTGATLDVNGASYLR
jgi:NAD(P)-dependent dehydrogenase (short-subunit alcohol dehydrogenase family)